MNLMFSQSHQMRLRKISILINQNEVDQFLYPFHHFKEISFDFLISLGR